MGQIVVTNIGKAYKRYRNRWSRLPKIKQPGAFPS